MTALKARIFFNWRAMIIRCVLPVGIVLLFCPWLWQSMIDGYVSYSGVVVDKGIEHHILDVRGNERYIMIRNEKGDISKRYVEHYGYAFTQVGTFVVKKRGFSEYPRRPGERTPGELMRDLERDKERSTPNPIQ
jgi:hypothetical protein